MAVIRVNHTKNYTVMSNVHLRDKSLSLKAKGLLSQMLSLPPDWDYTVDGLVAINSEKVSAVSTALKELKEAGYLVVTKLTPNQTKSGRFEYVYDVYEEKQGAKKQDIENLGLEILPLENLGLNKVKKELSKDKQNTEVIKGIVDYLNHKAGSRFRADTPQTVRLINARLKEGYTEEDFKKVIDNKVADWANDSKMNEYLRPQTLFGTKFEGYLNQKPKRNTMSELEEMYRKAVANGE